MVEVAESLVFIAGLIGFEYAATRFGKSTRDGDDWVAHQDDSVLGTDV